MFPLNDLFIQAELDYRVERMIADRDAAQQRREARAAARRVHHQRSVRGRRHQTAPAR
ncbi:MAG: hypothetical protein ACR2FP_02530 [Nocardioidaceae bacterium]|jgi:hypothetical protein